LNFLCYAIEQIIDGKKTYLPDEMATIEKSQEKIGWDHLLRGRISIEWSKLYNKQTKTDNGQKWTANVIKQIWKYCNAQ
jgi:hypothetical protein